MTAAARAAGTRLAANPLRVVVDHRAAVTLVLGLLGGAVLLVVVANRLARRAGGWYVVRRRLGREARVTVAAFVNPVRRWLRYRRLEAFR